MRSRAKYFDSFKEEITEEEAYKILGILESLVSRLESVEMTIGEHDVMHHMFTSTKIASMRRLRGDG
jgi:hypothetical protein